MANQISMSQKQSIAALHAQGVSNRQIAALLNLHRDTVNRHLRLLRAENRPEAPPGDFSGIPPVDTVQPGCADRFELAGSGEVAECLILREGTSPAGAKSGEPASDVIWEETELIVPGAQPLLETGHGSFAEISQNQPEAPPGNDGAEPRPIQSSPFFTAIPWLVLGRPRVAGFSRRPLTVAGGLILAALHYGVPWLQKWCGQFRNSTPKGTASGRALHEVADEIRTSWSSHHRNSTNSRG